MFSNVIGPMFTIRKNLLTVASRALESFANYRSPKALLGLSTPFKNSGISFPGIFNISSDLLASSV